MSRQLGLMEADQWSGFGKTAAACSCMRTGHVSAAAGRPGISRLSCRWPIDRSRHQRLVNTSHGLSVDVVWFAVALLNGNSIGAAHEEQIIRVDGLPHSRARAETIRGGCDHRQNEGFPSAS